jgi:hypothetical protein
VPLGRPRDPVALRAVERHLLPVHGEEVLAKEFTQGREEVPEAAHDGVVAPHRIRGLGHVEDEENRKYKSTDPDGEDEQGRQEIYPVHC